MFKTRLISGILLVIMALVLIGTGGYVLLTSTCILSLIGLFELYRVLDIHKSPVAQIGYAMTVFYYINLKMNYLLDPIVYIILFLLLLLVVYVLSYPKYDSAKIMGAFFGFFYVPVMLSFIYLTREIPEKGQYFVWMIFLCAWGADTCAYCAGRLWGKHKLAPVLSPKKTVEGAIGGVVGAMLLNAIFVFVFRNQLNITNTGIIIVSIIGGVGALVSMVGDLAASAIKRNYDIKDYGKLIPGHGGVLDRFDSVIITAPIIYYLSAMTVAF